MTYTVNVSNIAGSTTEVHLHDFFAFCGKISSIEYNQEAKTAIIHFEKSTAVKTALMLNGGTLDGTTLNVTSDKEHEDEPHVEGDPAALHQSDKPRAAIAAEYLAKGYSLSDQILQRAIEIDSKQGISKRFLSYLGQLDHTIGEKVLGPEQTISGKAQTSAASATQQAKAFDEEKGLSKTAVDYYSKALGTPIGLKVKEFYTSTSKQVQDIHEEAKRISAEQKAHENVDAAEAVGASESKTA